MINVLREFDGHIAMLFTSPILNPSAMIFQNENDVIEITRASKFNDACDILKPAFIFNNLRSALALIGVFDKSAARFANPIPDSIHLPADIPVPTAISKLTEQLESWGFIEWQT